MKNSKVKNSKKRAVSLPKPKKENNINKDETFAMKLKEKILKSAQKKRLANKGNELKEKELDINSSHLLTKRKNINEGKIKPKINVLVEKVILNDSEITDEGKVMVEYLKGKVQNKNTILDSLSEEVESESNIHIGGKKKKVSTNIHKKTRESKNGSKPKSINYSKRLKSN